MKHNFEERRQNRIDHARQQAEKNKRESAAQWKSADDIAKYIPPGQPILVGHHSEKRHRKDLGKIDNAMRGSIDADQKAEHYADKAKSIENNRAIFSDDPDAVEKLEKKIQKLQAFQEFMKAANKCIKKKDKEAFLQLEYSTEKLWNQLNEPDFCRRTGFPSYKLTNNNQNISRLKKRLAEQQLSDARETTEMEVRGVRYVENAEANRVQLVFQHVPEKEVRERLKSEGFRWCRSEGAWQRHLNNAGIWAAKKFLENL